MNARLTNDDDKRIGKRIRLRRLQVDMSQEDLGNRLGVTFQQIQKYENGSNRVSSSRLIQIARALQMSPAFFLDVEADEQMSPKILDALATREGQAIVKAFARIADPATRRHLVIVVERVADSMRLVPNFQQAGE